MSGPLGDGLPRDGATDDATRGAGGAAPAAPRRAVGDGVAAAAQLVVPRDEATTCGEAASAGLGAEAIWSKGPDPDEVIGDDVLDDEMASDPVDGPAVAAGPVGATASDPQRLFALPRASVVGVIALGLAQAATLLCFILLLQQVLTSLTLVSLQSAQADRNRLLQLTGWLAATAVVLGFLRTGEFWLSERAGYQVVRRLRMAMYGHLQRMTPAQLRGRARGGLLLRLTGDLSMLRMWLSRGVLIGTSSAIVLLVGVAAAIWLNAAMGLVFVFMVCLGAVASLGSGLAMRRATRVMRRRRSLVIGNLDEQINALEVVQMAGRSKGEYARLSRQNDSLTSALIDIARLRGRLRGIAFASGLLATVGVLAAGVVQVFQGGTTVAVIAVEILISRFLTRPVRSLGLAHDYWHRGQVSKQKILEFLRSSARPADDDRLPRLKVWRGELEFDDVRVDGALNGFTATAGRGQIVALVGGPGSGAGTVLEVVARLVDPTAGTLRIDGQDVAGTAPWSAGTQIGYYRSDLLLMRGTIGRNLTYAMPEADPEEIQRLVLGLGLDELLGRLGPAGTKTWLTEGGRNLAPHDRNLVAFARALMGNPRILLLDEPLEGLHPADRPAARRLILHHPGTVLWRTAEPQDVALADQVWSVEDGRLAQTCTGAEYSRNLWQDNRKELVWLGAER